MADGPDEQDSAEPSPDPFPAPVPAKDLPVFHEIDDLPAPDPNVPLINDEDLSWVDKPELTEEERERRRERREAHKKKVRRKRRGRRALKISGALFATFLVLLGFWFFWTFSGLQRMPTVAGQGGLDTPGTNFLLIGDNPSEPGDVSITGSGWEHAFKASDMVMVLHVTRNDDTMYVVSIPGSSVLPIPAHGSEPASRGKLSDAFAAGGQKLYVKTIEDYTGAAMDRVVVLDMNGLREITDEVGGVIMDVPVNGCRVPIGPRRFNGEEALRYAALYPCLQGHDLDRVRRQQDWLRALMRDAVDGGSITNPFTVSKLLKATAGHLTLEKDFGYASMFSTLFSMRGLRSTSTAFITAPTTATPFSGGTDTVALDPAKNAALWEAVRSDKIKEYLALNQDVVVR